MACKLCNRDGHNVRTCPKRAPKLKAAPPPRPPPPPLPRRVAALAAAAVARVTPPNPPAPAPPNPPLGAGPTQAMQRAAAVLRRSAELAALPAAQLRAALASRRDGAAEDGDRRPETKEDLVRRMLVAEGLL